MEKKKVRIETDKQSPLEDNKDDKEFHVVNFHPKYLKTDIKISKRLRDSLYPLVK